MTVITRNVSNKHSPVQSGSSSDWPQPNWSIIDWSSAAWQTRTDWRKVANAVVSFQLQLPSAALGYGLLENAFPFHVPLWKDTKENAYGYLYDWDYCGQK